MAGVLGREEPIISVKSRKTPDRRRSRWEVPLVHGLIRTLPPMGMSWVWVNGVAVVRDVSLTGAPPGYVLRRAGEAA